MEKNRVVLYAGIASFWGIVVLSIARHLSLLEKNLALRLSAPLLIIAGVAVLFAISERHEYFVQSAKYQFFARKFGETGAKWIYSIVGLLLIALGIFILLLPYNS